MTNPTPLCPICRAGMSQAIPADSTAWTCVNHGNFLAGKSAPISAAVQTAQASGSYVPGTDVLSVATTPLATLFPVTDTQVMTAAVAAGGSGGTNGAVTLIGTTGVGTKFQCTGTIAANAISGALVVTVPGDYTTNPSNLAAEPVTGGGLVGATLTITMGVLKVGAPTQGDGTASTPANPAATTNSGSATGCTLNLTMGSNSQVPAAVVQSIAEKASGATAGDLVAGL